MTFHKGKRKDVRENEFFKISHEKFMAVLLF